MLTSISEPQTQSIDPRDGAYWSQVRSQFMLEPGHAYLNNAALGMPPKPVRDAVAEGFRLMSENPSKAKTTFHHYIEDELRPAIAVFLGAETSEVALARNATEGLYHIINGLDLAPGDRILVTSQEHPSAMRPWRVRAERDGIEIKEIHIPSPLIGEDDILERISGAIDDRTKILFFCHVTRGGYLYPVKRLCDLARARGLISAIDGAQAVGMLDVDLAAIGSDLYTNSLHKWFLGPAGTGFLYVRRAMQPSFSTLYSPADEPGEDARRYEIQGTYDLPVRAALGTALDFLNRIGFRTTCGGASRKFRGCGCSPTRPTTSLRPAPPSLNSKGSTRRGGAAPWSRKRTSTSTTTTATDTMACASPPTITIPWRRSTGAWTF